MILLFTLISAYGRPSRSSTESSRMFGESHPLLGDCRGIFGKSDRNDDSGDEMSSFVADEEVDTANAAMPSEAMHTIPSPDSREYSETF